MPAPKVVTERRRWVELEVLGNTGPAASNVRFESCHLEVVNVNAEGKSEGVMDIKLLRTGGRLPAGLLQFRVT